MLIWLDKENIILLSWQVNLMLASKKGSCLTESESEFLLVIRLMTFIHQDLWYGKLVPSSHQRGKPSYSILCPFNRCNNRIWKSIPISDCLREEWALVNASSCSRGLKSQWVMISTAPNWGDKIICWNAALVHMLLICVFHLLVWLLLLGI